jgi:leucyl-tRNA synthetase
MAVPAHDQRDLDFARKFDLPIIQVVKVPNDDGKPTTRARLRHYEGGDGVMVNSGPLDGMTARMAATAIRAAIDMWRSWARGCKAANFRMRDWLISSPALLGHAHPDHSRC